MKEFKKDFEKFELKLKNNEPFALSRNNDGEMIILFNQYINNGEFIYDPNDGQYELFRKKMIESSQHRGDNYYVGIACRCCVGDETHEKIKNFVNQDEEHLTWGNIFVNSNYSLYKERMIPLFSNYDIVLVVNENAIISNLPFFSKIKKTFKIGKNAAINNYNIVSEMKSYINNNDIKNTLFLFCAGPFSNVLIYECYKESPNNTYLDIGSTLDNIMCLGTTRGYLRGAQTLNKTCIW